MFIFNIDIVAVSTWYPHVSGLALFGFYLDFPENLCMVGGFLIWRFLFCAFVAFILHFYECLCLPEECMIHPACCLLVLF
jgi:hypothetical protein